MEFTFLQAYTLTVVVLLIVALYHEWFNPALTFFIAILAFLLAGILTPQELLRGLSNQQIVVIFLLIIITAGIRSVFGGAWFSNLFNTNQNPRTFVLKMTTFSAAVSAFLNNTPIVAFLIPYVKEWANRTGTPASKLLIPLSYATILGGMITVIGTSTNLVLMGLISQYNLPLLEYHDFLFLGIIVTLAGIAYLYFIGYRLLPDHASKLNTVRQNLKEYLVEAEVPPGSSLIGKSVKDAGLRNLKDLFLVEIIRHDEVISPVSPEEVLEAGDSLYFSGNTQSIYNLIQHNNGLRIAQDAPVEQFNFVEAVIPASSTLIGMRIKDSDFRKKFNASIVAIHRDGKRVSGRIGERQLAGGDFLLLLSGNHKHAEWQEKDVFFVSVPRKVEAGRSALRAGVGIGSVLLLVAGIAGLLPLFTSCLIILTAMILFKILNLEQITRNLDFNLLMVLVCSLAIGVALEKSGAARVVATGLIEVSKSLGNEGALTALFLITTLVTALVTNPAAVSIMFPIAMELSEQLQVSSTPFFVAIAFAASGDFMTPIGYQTNLMVYGPGGYSFKDFTRVGAPLTVLYSIICISFITWYYRL
ncbi:MAG: SLC13 family permease [Cyclobacteriaceae bacterium]|nr:SLC13 family permease [Cyclobacteriaceae bacterium]